MKTKRYKYATRAVLTNALTVAATRFRENAETFRKLIDHKPDPNSMMQICGEAARALSGNFTQQADELRTLIQEIDAADSLTIVYDEEQVEEDD